MRTQKKILVVDDDLDLCDILRIHFVRLGYECLVAVNGKEAVEVAISQVPDLIVMDIVLPILDGLQATRLIREQPETSTTPILAMTAKATGELRQACLQNGCDDFIAKPFTSKQLTSLIESMLSQNSSVSALSA